MNLEHGEVAVWCRECNSYCHAISIYEVPKYKEAEALRDGNIAIPCPYPKKEQFDPQMGRVVMTCDTSGEGRYGRS